MDLKELCDKGEKNLLLVCRLCFEVVIHNKDTIHLKEFNQDILKTALDNIIDLGLTEDPLACNTCITTLTGVYNFKLRCFQNETMFKTFMEQQALDIKNKLDLQGFVYSKMTSLSRFCSSKRSVITEPLIIPKIEPQTSETSSAKTESKIDGKPVESSSETLQVPCVDDKSSLTIEQVILNWFPEDDATIDIKSEDSISMNTDSSPNWSNTDFKAQNVTSSTSKNPNTFKCTMCPFARSNRIQVSQHILNFHKEHAIKCFFCDKVFKQKGHLDSHLLNKHNKVPNIETFVTSKIHSCPFCSYRTINNFNRDRHVMVKHGNKLKTGETLRNFQRFHCKSCNYSSTNKGNLAIHLWTHSKKKPFQCEFCSKGFGQKNNLNLHILRHHVKQVGKLENSTSSTLYECVNCEFGSISKVLLKKHMKQHCV